MIQQECTAKIKAKHNKRASQTTPSTECASDGLQWIQMVAFPLQSDIESLWKRWRVDSVGKSQNAGP